MSATDRDTEGWRIYIAASMSTDASTDPLGIGINTNDPVPSAWMVSVAPTTGTFSSGEADTGLQCASNATIPAGARIFLVLVVEDDDGTPYLWSDPLGVDLIETP